MKEAELITGNSEICEMLGWKSDKAYVYQVPNNFGIEGVDDTGWTEFNTQEIGFHLDWNILIGAYNVALPLLRKMDKEQTKLYTHESNFIVKFGMNHFVGISDVNWQVNISTSWQHLVDFSKWYNSVKIIK